ncbi:proton channel OtopLc-like isoform X2 [Neocloeon triangulifer]|uniref:proton channel OtopLc-like isoform X2 n=1 Tax=Neocloeon triangulifer TaxID=2078957 RepID=UPI00286F3590|nr:proton channel OtopLc-like isoform X2 [Neocloeon triangulifer]
MAPQQAKQQETPAEVHPQRVSSTALVLPQHVKWADLGWSGNLQPGEALLLPSPVSPTVVLVPNDGPPRQTSPISSNDAQTRTHSRAHSGVPSVYSHHDTEHGTSSSHQHLIVQQRPGSNMGLRIVPAGQLPQVVYQQQTPGHPPYPHHHPTLCTRSVQSLSKDTNQGSATDALTTTLSALYGKLLVVMGIAFPMAEVISTYVPPSFYEGFYLYLYFGSMLFLLCMYATVLRPKPSAAATKKSKRRERKASGSDSPQSDTEGGSSVGSSSSSASTPTNVEETSNKAGSSKGKKPTTEISAYTTIRQPHYGSFYLRMGAVAFGIGSMIYSGLEFGQYFELERNTKCHNVLLALTPATRMAFIFIQMYFIFLNNEMRVYRSRLIARFGLMHMIGTNLSVWLNVLIQETKHEILLFYNPENKTLALNAHPKQQHKALLHRVARGLKGPHHIYECRRTNIMGSLVQDASPFLFPCTIEYSLICAAILYVMWKNIGVRPDRVGGQQEATQHIHLSHTGSIKRSPHHYSVDCARAHKGLFVGILALVLTIISLILFFVLISRPELKALAVMEVNICELTLYFSATVATLLGMLQIRELRYDGSRNLELDNILLIAAQTGMFIYSTFTVIGGHFTMEKNTALVLITAIASLAQTTCQTMFILDASRRSCSSARQIRRKPGRQLVTFLLVANLAMWAVNTLEKSRAESHPVQLHFYGLWAWTIITHVSMPLAIFYRFHSTVCLFDIWKRAYKLKPVYM